MLHKVFFLFCSLLIFNLGAQNYNACIKNSNSTIVVLGSSTAAGSGPSSPDSTWVNRYRKEIKSINQANLVFNLGVGGTTTYNIMPDWFTPPNGRPLRDSTKNISQAIRLGAEAIVVNMPSNDAARGYTAIEQLNNFRILKNVADSFNLKLWICTTQPRNGFNTIQRQIQIDVKDSLLIQYGLFALDFWNGFATSTHGLDSIFDSGDGVHINNYGHGVLANRVISKFIPNYISDTLSNPEFIVQSIFSDKANICGSSSDSIFVKVSNIGKDSLIRISCTLIITDIKIGTTITIIKSINKTHTACSSTFFKYSFNSFLGGNYLLKAYINSIDNNSLNDTLISAINRIGFPELTIKNDTNCYGDTSFLQAIPNSSQDKIVWYDSIRGGNILHLGSNLKLGRNPTQINYFAQAVRGNLYFERQMLLNQTPNVNYNGYMFDIVPLDTIILDSILIPIATTGYQKAIIYTRIGSHLNATGIAAKWNLHSLDSAQIDNSGDFLQLNFNSIVLTSTDTFGIYVHLQNSSSNLSYQRATIASSVSDSMLTIPSGTGISHTFGTTFYPRNFSGQIFYHHGFNPLGDCQSNRVEVKSITHLPYLYLGNDTTIGISDSVVLRLPNSFTLPQWSNGSTSSQLTINRLNGFQIGINSISLNAIDSIGCNNRDTILVDIQSGLGIKSNSFENFEIHPNPSIGIFNIIGLGNKVQMQVYNSMGKKVYQSRNTSNILDISDFPSGIYHLSVIDNESRIIRQIIKK